MSFDLMLNPSCVGCGSTTDLYGSNCKHMTLCLACGKAMAENQGACFECSATLTRLIREYKVRANSSSDKNYFVGRFVAGLPNFSKKNKWTLQKEGLAGRQVTDTLREKFKNKPWLLKDEVGQSQYHGQLQGAQSAAYYLLMSQPQAKDFVAIPAGSWYNFNKVVQYNQLTLEEAEEKMNNRRRNAEGYERWLMKAANNGPALFGESDKSLDTSSGDGRGHKKPAEDEEGNASDKGDEDEEKEADRKTRIGLNKIGVDDDDVEGRRGGNFDDDDDVDVEKGDDWEHEDIFTDDDEAVGNDPGEREDLAPEVPAPPEIKQDEEDEADEEAGLSKSGKELKKLLGRMNDSDEEDDDDSDDMEEEDHTSVLAPKVMDAPKAEPSDNSPAKPAGKGTPSTSKSAKGKRKKSDEDTKAASTPRKKVKTENYYEEQKPSTKDEPSKSSAAPIGTPPVAAKAGSSTSQGPVSEDEIRALLMQKEPVTTEDISSKFKPRMRYLEDRKAFAEMLKRISIRIKNNGQSYVVLRDR